MHGRRLVVGILPCLAYDPCTAIASCSHIDEMIEAMKEHLDPTSTTSEASEATTDASRLMYNFAAGNVHEQMAATAGLSVDSQMTGDHDDFDAS